MLNKVFQLVQPRQFEPVYKRIALQDDRIIVRPTYLSICHADQRYYQGNRAEEVLRQKLPMALIHEAIGEIFYDPAGEYAYKAPVVMVANTPIEEDAVIAENYLRSSKFRGSGFDGFMQEYVSLNRDRVLKLPEACNPLVAAFTEMVSVSYHAISRFDSIAHERRNTIGIWGDGNLGYITALLMRYLFPNSRIYVFGVIEYKLHDFSFADETFLVSRIPDDLQVDHAFECVGGGAATGVINQIIDHITPEGTISLMGVSEDPPAINTRMVLEKGLRMFGSSRSGRKDYEGVIALFEKNPDITYRLEKLVGSQIEVSGIPDMVKAFEDDIHKNMGKTIMKWNI